MISVDVWPTDSDTAISFNVELFSDAKEFLDCNIDTEDIRKASLYIDFPGVAAPIKTYDELEEFCLAESEGGLEWYLLLVHNLNYNVTYSRGLDMYCGEYDKGKDFLDAMELKTSIKELRNAGVIFTIGNKYYWNL
jgi:hypothetical protein